MSQSRPLHPTSTAGGHRTLPAVSARPVLDDGGSPAILVPPSGTARSGVGVRRAPICGNRGTRSLATNRRQAGFR
jgi:hypothetical protein